MNLLAIGVLAFVASDPVVEERTEYYEVTGSSARELKLALRELGPKGAEGVPPGVTSFATTAWSVTWKADYSSEPGRCSIKSLSTSVRILIVMPRWSGRIPGSALADKWDRLIQGLSAHERVHADHGITAAKVVRDQVSVVAPAPTCHELTRSIDSTYDAVIDKYRKADREYDQGAPNIPLEAETEDDNRAAWIASRGAVPLRVPSSPPADAAVTETERRRLAGMAELEAEMAGLSGLADSAGAAWRRYVAACPWRIETVAGGASGGRDWFDYAWPGSRSKAQVRECAEAEEFFVLADEVKHRICRADERARQAFVYPGTRRDLQTKFRLHWGGWDRACP